jgi:hypothetical protein
VIINHEDWKGNKRFRSGHDVKNGVSVSGAARDKRFTPKDRALSSGRVDDCGQEIDI